MYYTSTRDSKIDIESKDALLKGISKEGGLFVPRYFPKIELDDIKSITDYDELAYEIIRRYMPDFTEKELKYCTSSAYNIKKFDVKNMAYLEKVGPQYFLELFHGRTSAFKDMALSILPYFIEVALRGSKEIDEIVVITATSGDTGKAALEGFKNVENIKIAVFYPEDGVSNIQKRQMQTQVGDNVYVLGIKGNFDDCQNAVKEIFSDLAFNERLEANRIRLSSANSINIGRLIPQIVYYFKAYLVLLERKEIDLATKVNIVVPTGNFGNILAAYYGKKMGLPIKKLICASNENNVLTDFINTGSYDRDRELKATTSPSMDILISSNLERFLYHISDGDTELIKELMVDLDREKKYELPERIKSKMDFLKGYHATSREVDEYIRRIYQKEGYLIDTHTGVAGVCYDKYLKDYSDDSPVIIASTASPYKFAESILDSISEETMNLGDFETMEELEDITDKKIPKNLSELRDKNIRFDDCVEKDEILDRLKDFIDGDIFD